MCLGDSEEPGVADAGGAALNVSQVQESGLALMLLASLALLDVLAFPTPGPHFLAL